MAETAAQRDDASSAFFDGTATGELRLRRCDHCGQLRPPDARGCPQCHAEACTWVAVTGRGRLISWAVLHDRESPSTRPVGIVELDEGPWITTPLVDLGDTPLDVGLNLEVTFVRPGGGEAIPAFRPA
jgi:uncharacterized OB-fold protein